MALNLGFNFTARANPVVRALSDLTSEFRSLGKEILGLSRIQTMLSAFSFDKLDQMADRLKTIGTGGMELTSSWEAAFKANAVAMSKLGAQTGFTAEQSREMARQSFAMSKSIGMSTDVANEALIGMRWASAETKAAFESAFGVKTAEDLAKFATQSGLSAKDFIYAQSQLQKSLGFTSEQLAEMNAMAATVGKESGNMQEAFNALAGMADKMKARKNVFVSMGLDAKEATKRVAEQTKQTLGLGKVLQAQGIAGGLEAAVKLQDALAESASQFKDLIDGAATEFPGLLTALTKVGVSQDAVMQSMAEGPQDFMRMMAKAVDELERRGQDTGQVLGFVESQLKGALGDEAATKLADGLRDASKRTQYLTLDLKKLGEEGKKAGKEITKSYQDPRTAQEIFADQQAAFLQRFRALGTMTTNEFLKGTSQSFRDFGNLMQKTASEGGPLALVLNKMADIQKFGAAGLFPPDMQGPLVALGSTTETLISPLAKLRAAGINILSPFGLLTAAAAGLAAKFVSLKAQGKTTEEAFNEIAATVEKFVTVTLPKYAKLASKAIASFIKALFRPKDTENQTTYEAWAKKILDGITSALKSAFAFAQEVVVSLWAGLSGKMTGTDVLTGSDAEAIGAGIGTKLREALGWAKEETLGYIDGWWKEMWTVWSDPSMTMSDKMASSFVPSLPLIATGVIAFGPLVRVLSLVGTVAQVAFTAFSYLGSAVGFFVRLLPSAGTLLSGLWNVLSGVAGIATEVVGFLTGTTGAAAGVLTAVAALTAGFLFFPDATAQAVDAVAGFAGDAGELLGNLAGYIVSLPVKFLGFLFESPGFVLDWIGMLVGIIQRLPVALADALVGALEIVKSFVAGLISGIRDQLASQFPAAAGPIFTVFNAIQSIVETVVGTFQLGFTVVGEVLSTFLYVIERVYGTVRLAFEVMYAVIKEKLVGGFLSGFSVVGDALSRFGNYLWETFGGILGPIGEFFKTFYEATVTKLADGIKLIKDAFGSLKDIIGKAFDFVDEKLRSFLPKSAQPQKPTAEAAVQRPVSPATQTTPTMTPPPTTTSVPTGAVATGFQMPFSSLKLGAGSSLKFGAGASAFKGIPQLSAGSRSPAGLSQATSASAPPAVNPERLNDALVEAINHPAWVDGYIALLKQQHSALLEALRRQTKEVPPSVPTTGPVRRPITTQPAPPKPVAGATKPTR
jgi:hypothetical protein